MSQSPSEQNSLAQDTTLAKLHAWAPDLIYDAGMFDPSQVHYLTQVG